MLLPCRAAPGRYYKLQYINCYENIAVLLVLVCLVLQMSPLSLFTGDCFVEEKEKLLDSIKKKRRTELAETEEL